MLPTHGLINCTACFDSSSRVANPHPLWRIANDPGAWGNHEPKYLVLGFSKGSTQADIYKNGSFEDVAFAGMRQRLTQALRKIGVLNESENVDDAIKNPKSDFSFGSLIRCSVARRKDESSNDYACTGALIKKSFTEIPKIINRCTQNFLRDLPESLEIIILLGNEDGYAELCQQTIRNLYPRDFHSINSMSYRAGGKLWIHIAHPSGSNGHFTAWLHGSEESAAKKRLLVEAATNSIGHSDPLEAKVTEQPEVKKMYIQTVDCDKSQSSNQRTQNESDFYTGLCLIHKSGDKLYPVRIKDRMTGKKSFRVSRGGNTKEDAIEVEDPRQLRKYILGLGYAVRASSISKKRSGLYKHNNQSIIKVIE